MKKIVMIGCFDTKAEVFQYLYQQLTSLGSPILSINTGLFGSTELFPVNLENEELAAFVGQDLAELTKKGNRNEAVKVMAEAARQKIQQLVEMGEVGGVIGMGGGGGTYIALKAMQNVPFGIPKLCISTLATKDVSNLVGARDILLLPSVVDVAGRNSVIDTIIAQAAATVHHLSKLDFTRETQQKRIAISMFGNTTKCVDRCTTLLRQEGFEVFAFHANGSGGKSMEEMIRAGFFDAVLDVTTTELADDLCDGICSAGPDRLTAATELGIPQVVVPGCLDMVNFGTLESVPNHFQERNLYQWSPDVTLLRTNEEENQELGKRLMAKLRGAEKRAVVVLPLKGISEIDREGSRFHDAFANQVLFDTIHSEAGSTLPVLEQNKHINDPEFAHFLVETLLKCMNNGA